MTNNEQQEAVVLERTLDAPVHLIWRMWTEPAFFSAWYGPDGATIHVETMDVWVGGARRIRMQMQSPNGPMHMWFAGEHLEVIEDVRLVYTEAMTDETGAVMPMGPGGHAPALTEVRVLLSDADGRTKMELRHVGIPAGSPGEAGWAMALEKLAREARRRAAVQ